MIGDDVIWGVER